MPRAGRSALARSTLSQKPAARCPRRPHAALGFLRLRQRRGAGAAGSVPRKPPCLRAARAAPIRGRPEPPVDERQGTFLTAPDKGHPSALFLGRVPWIFGYAYYRRIDVSCIICFGLMLCKVSSCLSSYRYEIIPS